MICQNRFLSSRHRIRNTPSAPFHCRNRSLTVFSCESSWACRIAPASAQCCWEMDRREMLKELKPVMSPRALIEIQDNVRKVYASPALLDYLQDLLDASRQRHITGLSPRAGLALLHASQAWALMQGREMLLPEDIQTVGVAVMAHRLGHDLEQSGQSGRTFADNLLHTVPVP